LIRNFELRRSICKFRVSSHHLQIELGRYQGIPRHQRLCQQCSSGEVEDEINFLFKCSKYEPDRKELINIISTSCQNFNSLNDVKKLEWICNCEDHNILTHLGVFLRKHCADRFLFSLFIFVSLSVSFFPFCSPLDVLLLCLRHEVECHSYICWTSPEALSLGVCGWVALYLYIYLYII
jgi:hypothetical protein